MSRTLKIGVAQSGPISRDAKRDTVVARLIDLLRDASGRGCDLVVFTECALTAFFPHWWIENDEELNSWFEREMPSDITRPLFEAAEQLQTGFCLGFAELDESAAGTRRFNSCVLVDQSGAIVGKHRKIHLPGHSEHRPHNPFQNLERRYFTSGDLGFRTWSAFGGTVGMCICNDRRWSETYRLLGLGGAELILLGYNTPDHIPEHPQLDRLADFHHHLCMQAGALENGAWVVACAKAGVEEGVSQIGGSCIIAPTGEIIAQTTTRDWELIVADCDLDACAAVKSLYNLAASRRIEHYRPIVEQAGPTPPNAG